MDERTDEQRKESQELHQQSQKQYDRGQNALCFVVIGSIFLIIGAIFIFIANRRRNNVMVGIDTSSLAFYIMVLCLGLGAIATVFGLIKFFVSYGKRKKIIKKINSLK